MNSPAVASRPHLRRASHSALHKALETGLRSALAAAALIVAGSAFAQAPPTIVDDGADNANAQIAQAQSAQAAKNAPNAPMSENEAAGLPDLATINRPGAAVSSSVELNTVREPSFHTRDRAGTEVTEYRDRGKPTEIDVRSNFGTRYQMSNPTDSSPRVPSNGAPNGRVPSISLTY